MVGGRGTHPAKGAVAKDQATDPGTPSSIAGSAFINQGNRGDQSCDPTTESALGAASLGFEGEKYRVAALLALTPNTQTSNSGLQALRIQAEAKSADDMSEFVKALQEERIFSNVVITHHEINDQDPNKPIRFTVDANWSLP